MAITIDEVKNFLEQPAQDLLSDVTVTQNIERSQALVDSVKRAGAVLVNIEHAVRSLAVWFTYGSYVEGMSQQIGAQGISEVKTKLEHYRRIAQLFINLISASAISLDPDGDLENMIGVPPEIAAMGKSEGYNNA